MTLTTFFTRILLYVSVLVGIYAAMVYDAMSADFGESSLTEYAQELLLLLVIAISVYSIRKHHPYRTIYLGLAAMAAVSLIREFNNFAYTYLFPYAWQVGVLMILIPFAIFLYRNFRVAKQEFMSASNTYAFAILVIGTLVLHVFSRLYGLHLIWKNLMGEQYLYSVVRASEESIELLGYSILFIGVAEFYVLTRQQVALTFKQKIIRMPIRQPIRAEQSEQDLAHHER